MIHVVRRYKRWDRMGRLRFLIDQHLTKVHDSIFCPLSNTRGSEWTMRKRVSGHHSNTVRHGAWCQTSHVIWHGEWWYNESRRMMTHQYFSTSTHQRAPSSSVWSACLRFVVMYFDQCTSLHRGKVSPSPLARLMFGIAALPPCLHKPQLYS